MKEELDFTLTSEENLDKNADYTYFSKEDSWPHEFICTEFVDRFFIGIGPSKIKVRATSFDRDYAVPVEVMRSPYPHFMMNWKYSDSPGDTWQSMYAVCSHRLKRYFDANEYWSPQTIYVTVEEAE